MITIVVFMGMVWIATAQKFIRPAVIKGIPGTCPPEQIRYLMHQNLSQSVANIVADTATNHPCGPGQWTRVAYLNMSDPLQQCPSPWRLRSANGVRACGIRSSGCNSQNYTVFRRYNKVCGRIIGYQVGSTDAFLHSNGQRTINQSYVDGVSVTYGEPRKHIWTFASGITETSSYPLYSCPCAQLAGTPQPPSFVGNN